HLERLHHNGLTVEPTCAVGPAALAALRDRGAIESGESVVVPLTGRAK
ncbi:threonine synthase, partial [Halobacteriales archaeon QH_10_67_13]